MGIEIEKREEIKGYFCIYRSFLWTGNLAMLNHIAFLLVLARFTHTFAFSLILTSDS